LEAAPYYRKDKVELLIANKADVNARDKGGMAPLHSAVSDDPLHFKVAVELLLAKGAKVNAKDNDGLTPLHVAAASGNKDVVDFLRKHGGHE
jgi:ankyrin repeat protein